MPTVLDVSRALKNPGQGYHFEANGIEIDEMIVLDDPVRFVDVSLNGEFMGAENAVSIRGSLTAKAAMRCARCLGEVMVDVESDFNESFVREADPDDPDLYPFEGHSLELNEAVKNALVLELPYRVLCSEQCKGLCPQCGKNLNKGSCTCQEGGKVMNPFSALKAIVEGKEEV